MAFATNSSAFGIKPQTQTTSLFGSNQQQPSSSTAFGATTQQPQSTLFGSTQNQQQPSTTNNLFGQPTNQQQQPAGNNLFGQSTNQQQPAAGTNIFGSTNQQAPAAGGNLFGQSTNQQQPLPAGNLFGQSTQQPQTQQQQPTNAFGSNLFGGLTTTQPNQSTTQPQQGAFGGFMSNTQQQQQQQQPTNGLFGGNTLGTNTQGNAFGGGFGTGNTSLFGAKPPQQQQSVGLQGGMSTVANVPAITKNTKFNDLPEEMKRTLEQIDTYIQGRVQISKDLHQRKLGEEPLKGQELIRSIHKELISAASIIRNDVHATQDLKAKVDQAVEDTIVATRIVDEFRNPPAGSAYRKDHAAFPLEFFSRVTNQMKDRLAWYKATIEAIERKLSATTTQSQTPQGISATLQAQHQTFIALASKTAAVDAELQKIKALYTQLWRAKTGSVRDPFNDLDTSIVDHRKGDFGMSALSFR